MCRRIVCACASSAAGVLPTRLAAGNLPAQELPGMAFWFSILWLFFCVTHGPPRVARPPRHIVIPVRGCCCCCRSAVGGAPRSLPPVVVVVAACSTIHDTNAATNIANGIVIVVRVAAISGCAIGPAATVVVVAVGCSSSGSSATIGTARSDTDFHDIDPIGALVGTADANLQATTHVGTGITIQSRSQ